MKHKNEHQKSQDSILRTLAFSITLLEQSFSLDLQFHQIALLLVNPDCNAASFKVNPSYEHASQFSLHFHIRYVGLALLQALVNDSHFH